LGPGGQQLENGDESVRHSLRGAIHAEKLSATSNRHTHTGVANEYIAQLTASGGPAGGWLNHESNATQTALRNRLTHRNQDTAHCVTHLLHQALPNDDPLIKDWQVDAARINLYYPPAPGKGRNKVVTVEITHRGRLNLHKFDSALQALLESYLVSLGILNQGQTLHAHEAKTSRQPTYQN
jgi:hypothetical protein